MKLLSATVLAAALLAGCGGMKTASMPDTPTRTVDNVLIGPNGMTLYTSARDVADSGKSTCYAQCATNWPALTAPDAARPIGGYTVLTRDDGKKQWAYKGWPLYYWSKDTKAGDTTGDGMMSGNWKIARP